MAYSTKTLAAGSFGKVYKEKYNDTWAAIKKVPQHLINRRDLERECQVYNKAIHPNIVKLLGNPTLKDSKWIIPMEFIFGEELETTIFKSQKSKIQLTPSIKATIITGMCEGLLHLHSKDIVHQDLKPENIMVEHDTHRAVIIDMGLAKFFRNGLNSAVDMGNEAYSPPEVLQRRGHRDQRSDVWAMGKIIAELCARVRLHTPSVCPAKIHEILSLQGQQYCNAVCRMVQSDPTVRATMAGITPEIRKAVGGGNTEEQQKGHLPTPFPYTEIKVTSPRPQAPVQQSLPLSRAECAASPRPEVKTLVRAPVRAPSPSIWERAALPKTEVKTEVKTTLQPQPVQRSPSPSRWERAALPKTEVKTEVKTTLQPQPVQRSPSPSRWERAALPKTEVKTTLQPQPVQRSPSPSRWERAALPKTEVKTTLQPQPVQRSPSPSRWERAASPNPEVKISSSPLPKVDQGNALVPSGMVQPSQDVMKQLLYEEALKGLPCPLPTTGKVRIRRYEQRNGEVETWEQKEVETEGGRIVKFEDVMFNNKS
ncbi:serine/threonine-protein kinase Nek8 isoform X16 [Oncorhynchus keta]|uniref:serine/threonine-protein kinase Nek8 isoform X14 n=1 Tax=Oncorhynchus keta TaxID=8018 RepID=UPI00227A11B2|nr:serine/threonine-protein kinase Nek8 isoform X14 [Oncorhynchus keta]XP_052345438.1 serine/threonine-protein kinase Nek8 isoform X15 [Oncorhynchus keta]XP_052345439.1 serine/threonine-protein kinase Nek8 isoform X16 [Oncorhynchus keta]